MKLNKAALDLARARKCLAVRNLAKQAKVSTGTIYTGFEREIDPVAVGKLAAALGVDVTEIIIQDDER